MSAVDDTIAKWRRSDFDWDGADCILSVCDHVENVTGIDPASPWRGTYSTEEGAEAICGRFGGLLGLFSHGMDLAGLKGTESPVCGDPVVAKLAGMEVAGLYRDGRVVFRTKRGVVEGRAQILGAWSCQ